MQRPPDKVYQGLFFFAQTVCETEMEMTELQTALWLKQILYKKEKQQHQTQ